MQLTLLVAATGSQIGAFYAFAASAACIGVALALFVRKEKNEDHDEPPTMFI